MTEFTDQENRRRMPSIAVSMPAHNAAPFIGAAIESVLTQRGVVVQLVVVDDASTDGTADVAAGFADRGVRLHRNVKKRGIGFCHNLVIRETTAPLIAHLDADDVLAPDALASLARALLGHERAGQAYCDFYDIDRDGVASATARERWRGFFVRHRAAPIDHARELVVHGMVVNCLRTYRRDVFDTVGMFDEGLPWAVDYEMALRIAEHFIFVRVPEMLYARRVHAAGVTQGLRAKSWRFCWMRWKLVRRQLRAQGGVLFGRGAFVTYARLLLGLAYVLRAAIKPASTDS